MGLLRQTHARSVDVSTCPGMGAERSAGERVGGNLPRMTSRFLRRGCAVPRNDKIKPRHCERFLRPRSVPLGKQSPAHMRELASLGLDPRALRHSHALASWASVRRGQVYSGRTLPLSGIFNLLASLLAMMSK